VGVSTDFATIDFETTGLRAGRDRVLEIGVVRTDSHGNTLAEYSTLVNPSRDVGPTSIHGITASAVLGAPRFEEVLPDLSDLLNGAILVAHNAKFDVRFLRMELERSNCEFDEIDALCTLELMYMGFPRGPRKLTDCCRFFGIPCGEAHDALEDARMASGLLHFLLGEVPLPDVPLGVSLSSSSVTRRAPYPRSDTHTYGRSQGEFLRGLIDRLDDGSSIGVVSAVAVAQYMNFLDRVLEDRLVSEQEAAELAAFASELELGRERIEAIHATYVANLCALAKSDGLVTDLERSDLGAVADLLSVRDWRELLDGDLILRSAEPSSVRILAGHSVCFTGEMEHSRSELSERCARAGLKVKTGVTKDLDILVVADANSMSGKAKKARSYGVRMVAERAFLQMLEQLGPG
jgi:DNA polymerase-3 subunit epsilon